MRLELIFVYIVFYSNKNVNETKVTNDRQREIVVKFRMTLSLQQSELIVNYSRPCYYSLHQCNNAGTPSCNNDVVRTWHSRAFSMHP